jgi:hypothetical protein
MNTYTDLFIEAIKSWLKLTDTKFEQNSFSSMGQVSAGISNSKIKKAIYLDPEGFLPLLVLFSVFNDYCRENRFKLYDIIYSKSYIEKIECAKNISQLLNNPLITSRLENEKKKFFNILSLIKKESLLTEKDCKDDSIDNLNISNESFIDILFEAKSASVDLRIDQFSKGVKSKKAPVLSDKIYQSYSVHNFINSLAKNSEFESIIAMCLIKDVYDPLFSYFVIGIRNGQKIYVLSDKYKEPHPLYKTRTRRAGKHQEKRMEKYWFPYYLLDFDVDYRGDLIANKKEKGIVNSNIKDIPLCQLKDMKHENLLWYIELYHHLVDKFFIQNFDKEDLSYTGYMINLKEEDNELSQSLMVKNSGSIAIDIPSSKNISLKVEEQGNFEYPILNNKGLYNNVKIEALSNELLPFSDCLKEVEIQANGISTIAYTYDKNTFGTKKEIQENVIFISRFNEAQLIKAKLKKNFNERKEEIKNWYYEKINNNKELFFKAIADGKFLALTEKIDNVIDVTYIEDNILLFGDKEEIGYGQYGNFVIKHNSSCEYYNYDSYSYCAYNGKKTAYYKAMFCIKTASAIAKVTGVDIYKLPIEIQNYGTHKSCSGNPILDRVDPIESIENPFNKMNFYVDIYLSKSGYKEILKKYSKL